MQALCPEGGLEEDVLREFVSELERVSGWQSDVEDDNESES